ncbi:MAG: DNA repair protein RecN [Candidatus Coatesbacteria bacterium]
MLKELRIRNLAIIEDVNLEFEPGLTVLTGETGAGKSILVDGLSLVLGERADRDQVRAGAAEARIEAVFDLEGQMEVHRLLAELELPDEEPDLILRRVITAAGKTRCSVNGSPVPLSHLKRIGDLLADLHGQHEHQLLLDPTQHLFFVDAFGGLLPAREGVRRAWAAWQAARVELDAARAALRGRSERLDLLVFQVDELEQAKLEPGEADRLAAERSRLANAQKLTEALTRAHDSLLADGGAGESLGVAINALRAVADFDTEHIGSELESLRRLVEMVRDEGNNLRGLVESLEADPHRLEQIEERLDLISRMEHKYGGSIESALATLASARGEAAALTSSDETVAALEAKAESARQLLSKQALDLSDDRSRASAKFAELVARELGELAMGGADFGVRMSQQADPAGPVESDDGRYRATADGIDTIEFYLAPNVGEGTRPLKAIASGGELSRIMLGLKTVLAAVDRVGTLVFDEIDSGIGGRVAEVVGRKLREIGAERQVLVITHLPQIAAKAGVHILVAKIVEEGHTKVEAGVATGKARLNELARMLAGSEITASALKHAETLLREG